LNLGCKSILGEMSAICPETVFNASTMFLVYHLFRV